MMSRRARPTAKQRARPPGTVDVPLKLPLLSGDEETRLLAEARPPYAPDVLHAARHRLVLHNLLLAVHVVRKYFGHALAVLGEDLIEEAYCALIEAVDGYKPDRGPDGKAVRFNTYAMPFIWGYLKSFVKDHGYLIRVPRYLYQRHDLYSDEDDPEERETVRRAKAIVRASFVGFGDDEHSEYGFVPGVPDPCLEYDRRDEQWAATARVGSLLAGLGEPDADVIRRVFGVGREAQPKTQAARDLGVTKQAVDKRLDVAMKRLKRLADGLSASPRREPCLR
jgi:RNA polymerase sigma factor (sigma-70 family)